MPTTVVDRPDGVASPPAVLLTHGAGGDLRGRGLVALSRGLAAAGHLSVRANLPYRDAGRRSPPRAEQQVEPYAAVVTAVTGEQADGPWALGGKSYGGRVASMAVAAGLVEATALVFYGYPLHPPGKPDRLRVDHWPDIGVPCLFLQGSRDPFCDLSLLDRHLGDLAGPATLEIVDGGDHSLATRRGNEAEVLGGLAPRVATWLERHAP